MPLDNVRVWPFEAYRQLVSGPEVVWMVGEVCGGQTLQVLAPGGQTTTYAMAYEGPALPEFERVYAGLAYEMSPAG